MTDSLTAIHDTQENLPLADAPARGWTRRLFTAIPIAPLVYFRIVFGAIMVLEIGRYFAFGWVRSHFLTDRFQFKYYGFEWVEPWPGGWLYLHFAMVGVAAVGITLGAAYRLSAILFFVGFTYIYLLDQIYYLNHLYLVCLLAFLSVFMPAHRALSVDARLRPRIRSATVPAWTLFLLRFQIAVVYIYGGIAKLNPDWLRGEPIRAWLMSRSNWPLFGPLLRTEAAVWLICYGGLLLDLLVVPLLLWRRTRRIAVIGLVFFHLSNAFLFNIGIFPWLMLAVMPLFFPLTWWSRKNRSLMSFEGTTLRTPNSEPCTDTADTLHPDPHLTAHDPSPLGNRSRPVRMRLVFGLIAAYVLVQVLVPLRHFLYPGVVHWTEEGHRFSWHMKLRAKGVHVAEFRARDPNRNIEWLVPTEPYLPRAYLRRVAARPDMVLQLTHAIARDLREQGHPNVEVYARILASLNDHPVQNLVDPSVDLAHEPRSLRPAHWIIPLHKGPPHARQTAYPMEPDAEEP